MGVMGVRVRFLLPVLLILSLPSLPLLARTHIAGYAEQGGQRHRNSGVFAITRSGATQTDPYTMQSYPNALVTVYISGTLTAATLYSDPAGTSKSNPFTASSNAYWSFYVDSGIYDIRFSGGGIATPYTWSGISTIDDALTVPVTGLGAVCDGTTDDTIPIQLAINLVGGHIVSLPAGICKTTDQLLIAQHDITIQGAGARASQLLYAPTVGDEAAIKVDFPTATTIIHTVLRDFGIFTADTTLLKIGIWIVDGSETRVENIQIGTGSNWRGGANLSPFTGTGSIGIKIQGRDFGTYRNVTSAGAIPLYIGQNPNAPGLDLDHHAFEEFYFLPNGDNPSVYVETGLSLTNDVWRNGAWVGGSWGFYWLDTTSVGISSNLIFDNIRAEQFTAANYTILIDKNANLRGLTISHLLTGTGTTAKGVYLDNVDPAVIDNYRYSGTLECIRMAGALDWRSSVCGTGSTKDLGTLTEIWASGLIDGGSPMPRNGYYEYVNSELTGGRCYRFMGVGQCAGTGSLTNTSTTQIPSFSGVLVTGKVDVTFKGATLNGAFSCTINSARTVRNWTTDATIADCTGNVAGDITIDWVSASSILLRNNLGETVTYNWVLTLN
jgi:hypothetical protein